MRFPKIGMVGNRGVPTVEPLRRSVEEMKAVGDNTGHHFGSNSSPRESFTDTEKASGSCDGTEDGVGVDGFYGAEGDHLDVAAFGGALMGGLERLVSDR